MSRPLLVRTRDELDAGLRTHVATRARIALVPTMGALHAGHVALLRRARREAQVVVASVFVNPAQFAPGEDFASYPRSLEADMDVLAHERADVVFVPEVDTVYPEGADAGVSVHPGDLGAVLEGAARPTHFRGVLTVVAKLFGLVRPDVAVFGEKDYQQLVLVRRMARDLCLPVRVLGEPTVREPDGLAVSSRNANLGDEQRHTAPALARALAAGIEATHGGAAAAEATKAAEAFLAPVAGLDTDYVAITDPELGPAPASGPARLLLAARLGGTRLIDNAELVLGTEHG